MFHAYDRQGDRIKNYSENRNRWDLMVKKLYVYAVEKDYNLVCIIKTAGGYGFHWYFVKKNFEHSTEIIDLLRNIQGVEYYYRE